MNGGGGAPTRVGSFYVLRSEFITVVKPISTKVWHAGWPTNKRFFFWPSTTQRCYIIIFCSARPYGRPCRLYRVEWFPTVLSSNRYIIFSIIIQHRNGQSTDSCAYKTTKYTRKTFNICKQYVRIKKVCTREMSRKDIYSFKDIYLYLIK